MKHGQFSIGCHFYTGAGKWRCTDIGQRTIIAIRVDEHPDDLSWLSGPPYAVAEIAFDEYDLEGCHLVNIWNEEEEDGEEKEEAKG